MYFLAPHCPAGRGRNYVDMAVHAYVCMYIRRLYLQSAHCVKLMLLLCKHVQLHMYVHMCVCRCVHRTYVCM